MPLQLRVQGGLPQKARSVNIITEIKHFQGGPFSYPQKTDANKQPAKVLEGRQCPVLYYRLLVVVPQESLLLTSLDFKEARNCRVFLFCSAFLFFVFCRASEFVAIWNFLKYTN